MLSSAMSSSKRPVDSLRPTDLLSHPVWEFVSDDQPDETSVDPVAERPASSLKNRIMGAESNSRMDLGCGPYWETSTLTTLVGRVTF